MPFHPRDIGYRVTVAESNVMIARCVAKHVIGEKRVDRKGYVTDQQLMPFAVALPRIYKNWISHRGAAKTEPSSTSAGVAEG